MQNSLVSIIIINWNGKQFLEKCLSSVYKQNYHNFEVILVDNASHDDSIVYVKKNFPKVKIIRNNNNLGFAEANNIGYHSSHGDYTIFLNNDTEVTKEFVTNLVHIMEKDHSIGAAQSKLLLMDDSRYLDSIGAFLTMTGFLYHYGLRQLDKPKLDTMIDLYTVKGAAAIFRKEVLDRVAVNNEIFDSSYFAYFEETDLCHRVWLAGYRVVYIPDSVVYHKVGGTSSRMYNDFIQYHSFKNRMNSYIKNLDFPHIITILPLHLILVEAYAALFLFTGKLKTFFAIQKAILWNIKVFNKTLKKRRYIRHFIKSKKFNERKVYKKILKDISFSYYFNLLKG